MLELSRKFIDYGDVDVLVIGAGGIGSYMVGQLAQIDYKMRQLTDNWRQFNVTVVDGDTVSATNIGAQNFYPCDIARSKAAVLVERINLGFGTQWAAIHDYIDADEHIEFLSQFDIIITCVDKAAFRVQLGEAFVDHDTEALWLDGGVSTHEGNVTFGHLGVTSGKVPNVWDLNHNSLAAVEDDPTDSCSHAQALQRQDYGVGQFTASLMAQALWQLFRHSKVKFLGNFFDVRQGEVIPFSPTDQTMLVMGFDRSQYPH